MARQQEMQENASNLTARKRKELNALSCQIEERHEYHERLHVVADQQIDFELDDSVMVNYAKFGNVVAKLK